MSGLVRGTMKRPVVRVPSHLPESLHGRLNSYTLAASAAGVSVLALSCPSEAKIVYTPTHKVLHASNPPKTLPLDLNNDGIVDFTFFDLWFVDQDFGPTGWLYPFRARTPNGLEAHTTNFGTIIVSALDKGAKVGGNAQFVSATFPAVVMCHATDSGRQGLWCQTRDHYLGLRFVIRGKTHYGWARLSTALDKDAHITATLTGYAYETIPNKPIIAGRTHGKDDATLGRLAQGASGVAAWRQKD
jgi:hypothetical protein